MSRGGFNAGVVEEEFTGFEDRRWNQPKLGWDRNRSKTLDVSLFLPAHITDKGALPSGLVLAERADNPDLVGPYTPIVRRGEKTQTITRSATGGTGKLEVDNVQTDALATTAAAFTKANIDAALIGLPGIDADSFTSVQTSATVLTVTGDIPDITYVDVNATGGTVVTEVTQAPDADGLAATPGLETPSGFLFTTTKVGKGDGSDLATAANIGVAMFWGGGIIYKSHLPTFTGTNLGELDAYAETILSNFNRIEA